jgi:acyl-CoA synthetase (NDP forming)
VIADANVDQVIVRAPRSKDAAAWGGQFAAMADASPKPIIVNWPSSVDDHGELLRILETRGIPCFTAPTRAVRALAELTRFSMNQRQHASDSQRSSARVISRQPLDLPSGAATLGEHAAKKILSRYGIAVVGEVAIAEADIARLEISPLSFPVAIKVDSADIPHKTEAGAVALGITDLVGLKRAAKDVLAAARAFRPDARIDGVLIQQMASGVEVIVGAVNDPYFGPTITFGLGGIFAELLSDVSRRFAPFDRVTAHTMIEETRAASLLKGYRGRELSDVAALADALCRVSLLAADHADRIAELDINPLFVRRAGEGVLAADALIVLK